MGKGFFSSTMYASQKEEDSPRVLSHCIRPGSYRVLLFLEGHNVLSRSVGYYVKHEFRIIQNATTLLLATLSIV